MITELLAGLFFQSNVSTNFSNPSVFKSEISISRPSAPSRPSFSFFPDPEETPKPSKTPRPSRTPRATSTPKPSATVKSSPVVQGTQTSGITTQSVLAALNNYRSKNGAGNLQIDSKLQEYAQSRANHLKSIGKLDKHAGHKEFMASDGFGKLGFNAIAENQGYNYKGDAKGLIESFYGKSSGHNKNQLNPEYTHVGIGINGPFTNLVFGGRKR